MSNIQQDNNELVDLSPIANDLAEVLNNHQASLSVGIAAMLDYCCFAITKAYVCSYADAKIILIKHLNDLSDNSKTFAEDRMSAH